MICHYALWDQIAVAAHSETQMVEYLNFLQDGVFLHPVAVADGAYVTPARAGWSLEMFPEFIADHTYPDGKIWRDRQASGGITFLA
jgi:L-fuconate dehydratase